MLEVAKHKFPLMMIMIGPEHVRKCAVNNSLVSWLYLDGLWNDSVLHVMVRLLILKCKCQHFDALHFSLITDMLFVEHTRILHVNFVFMSSSTIMT
jgi:hypothetical protein